MPKVKHLSRYIAQYAIVPTGEHDKNMFASQLIESCPNFHKSGSSIGMRKKYYGMDALLVRYGSYIYNVSSYPEIYNLAH